ncbi:MAG: hypothetical protein Q7J31_13815, partial [Syntrophales bacterium]|nr:hypothetical protein [Syntrophales bacterium]
SFQGVRHLLFCKKMTIRYGRADLFPAEEGKEGPHILLIFPVVNIILIEKKEDFVRMHYYEPVAANHL